MCDDFSVRQFFVQLDAEDMTKSAQVETVRLPFLFDVCFPCFIAEHTRPKTARYLHTK